MNKQAMEKLIEGLFENSSILQRIADALWMYSDEPIPVTDLDVYSDGMSYAVRHLPTGNEFLFAGNQIDEDNVEEVEFTVWPPETMGLYGAAPIRITQ